MNELLKNENYYKRLVNEIENHFNFSKELSEYEFKRLAVLCALKETKQ